MASSFAEPGKDGKTKPSQEGLPAPPQPLLRAATDRVYMALLQKSYVDDAKRMRELSVHNGPSCKAHVPAHAVDAMGVCVAYPPEQLIQMS